MATSKVIFLVFPAILLKLCYAQVPSIGKCPPNVVTVQDLNLDNYLGKWYEYEKYPFIFELGGKCVYAEYGQSPNGDISVYNSNINRLTNSKSYINGTATVQSPGKLLVKFPFMPSFVDGANYWILDTDYINYSVVYSCTNILNIFHTNVVWILTREQFPSEEIVEKARSVLDVNKLSRRPLIKTDQTNCPAD